MLTFADWATDWVLAWLDWYLALLGLYGVTPFGSHP